MQRTWVAVAAIGLTLSGCYLSEPPPPSPCSSEFMPQSEVTPPQAEIFPEDTVQATYRVFRCEAELDVAPVWESADTAIATVSTTGLITAQLQGGNTTITVSEAEYGTSATISVSVPVVDPIP